MSVALVPNLLEVVRARLQAGKTVRRRLPAGGRLHIDRQVPFLVVYRRPVEHEDAGAQRLVLSQASYLIATGNRVFLAPLRELLEVVVESLSGVFGAFLLVEIWTRVQPPGEDAPSLVQVVTPDQQAPLDAVETLVAALAELEVGGWHPEIRHLEDKAATPPGLPSLLEPDVANRLSCYVVGVELDPIFRSPTGTVYPELLRLVATALGPALQRTIFAFAQAKTSSTPAAYQGWGRRWMVRAVPRIDDALGALASKFDFLRGVTPVDGREAWVRFEESGRAEPPSFRYQHLTTDPELLLRELYAVPLERIEDPTLEWIYREKLRELARQLTMLAERNTHRFLPGSLQLYGGVEPELHGLALEILERTSGADENKPREETIDAEAFAGLVRRELDRYRGVHAGFDARAEIRDDVTGLMVSKDTLLIDRALALSPTRARALIEHEIGTHLLTYFNGRSQGLQIFRSGLAGYEGLQEGLAVLCEHLVGGLTKGRLRMLAARVVAAEQVIRGGAFLDVFELLTQTHGLGRRGAFTTTMRATRGGGLTKDAIYLRGLREVLDYLRGGGDLALLFLGKFALRHLPLVQELLHRGVVRQPRWLPHALDSVGATERLQELREGRHVLQLLERPA
jgi:uncharacterized protein (TIGR02421 family)